MADKLKGAFQKESVNRLHRSVQLRQFYLKKFQGKQKLINASWRCQSRRDKGVSSYQPKKCRPKKDMQQALLRLSPRKIASSDGSAKAHLHFRGDTF